MGLQNSLVFFSACRKGGVGWQPRSDLSHEAPTDVSISFAVPGVGFLRGDAILWTHCKPDAMSTRPLRALRAPAPVLQHPGSPAVRSPAPKPVSSHAPRPLSPHLPSVAMPGKRFLSPDRSRAEPESFTVARQHLSSQGRGTSLSHCAAVRSLHGSSGQSPSPAGRQQAPRWEPPGDSATGGQGNVKDGHCSCIARSQGSALGTCALHMAGTVAAARLGAAHIWHPCSTLEMGPR